MTNLELLEEIRKDFVANFDNDPAINRTCQVMINEFKARSEQLNLCEVSRCVCKIPDVAIKVSENGVSAYCRKCAKTYTQT